MRVEMVNSLQSELLDLFFQELQSYIQPMKESLQTVRTSGDLESAGELHRLFHNVKGAASQVQLARLSGGARVVEDYLASIVEEGEQITDSGVDCVGKVIELLDIFVETRSADPKIEERFYQTVCQMQWSRQEEEMETAHTLAEVRSIFPLLHDLTECIGEDATHRAENEVIYQKLSMVLASLVDMSFSLGLAKQGGLLRDFGDLLGSVAAGGTEFHDEIAGVVKDFFSLAELAFVEDHEQRGLALAKVQKQLRNLKSLFTSSSLQQPDDTDSSPVDTDSSSVDSPYDALFDDPGAFDDSLDFIDEPVLTEAVFEGEEESAPIEQAEDDDLSTFFDSPSMDEEAEPAPGDDSPAGDGGVLPFDDPEKEALAAIFKEECEEHFITVHSCLHELEKLVMRDPENRAALLDPLSGIRRAVHTLKGAASITGVELLADGAHRLEDTLDWLHDNSSAIAEEDIQLIGRSVETLESLASLADEQQLTVLRQSLEDHLQEKKKNFTATAEKEESQEDLIAVLAEAEHGHQGGVGVLPEETSSLRVRLDDLDELLSIEGELVVARVAIEKRVGELSLALSHLEGVKDNLRRKCQELESGFEVKALYGGKPAATGTSVPMLLPGEQADAQLEEFDPLELDRYSELNLIIRSLNEIAVDVSSIHSTLERVTGDIGGQAAKQQLTMRQMQEKLMRIRMIPLSSISRVFHTTVRSAAATLQKPVDFDIVGEDVYMDRYVWTMVTDPLLHILRNAVDHGIEAVGERVSSGKPERGTILLSAEQRSRYVVLTVTDDGDGIDLDVLRENIIAGGGADSVKSLGEAQLIDHIFYPSFSTRADISRLSGRGVGLDVARKNVEELGGSIHVHNSPGKGLRFELRIPFSLSVNRAVLVRVSDSTFAVPLQDIAEIRQFKHEDVRRGDEPALFIDDEHIPFASLGSYVEINVPEEGQDGVAIIVALPASAGVTGGRIALSIGEVLEQREIIIKGLGSHLTSVQGIAGVTVTGSGDLIPILNLRELVTSVDKKEQPQFEPADVSLKDHPLKVLIVDDSISVRYSIARLVESQGWEQQQAVDGVDGLGLLETFRPDVIVLDIEMPRMNGYEFKSNINNREELRDIPVVMLTSRVSEKHRKKAAELGIDHYLTKPYEEEHFVQLLQNLEERRS